MLTSFGRHPDEVSTIAAISIAPRRQRVGLSWRTDSERYIFLQGLLRQLQGGAS